MFVCGLMCGVVWFGCSCRLLVFVCAGVCVCFGLGLLCGVVWLASLCVLLC